MTMTLGDISTLFGLVAVVAGAGAYVLSLKFVSKHELNGQLRAVRASLDGVRDEVREVATKVDLIIEGRIRTPGGSQPPRSI